MSRSGTTASFLFKANETTPEPSKNQSMQLPYPTTRAKTQHKATLCDECVKAQKPGAMCRLEVYPYTLLEIPLTEIITRKSETS